MERIETLRIAERDALLARLRSLLTKDPRVVAAWLNGSFGRGEADAWSDLDVLAVVRDGAYDPGMRHAFASTLGETLFTVEAPQNGPPGGTYLMAAYDAPTGPHLVDWQIQPLAFAERDDRRVLLLDRAEWPPEPKTGGPDAAPEPSDDEDAANRAALFWGMVLVQAKYVARKPVESGMGFEGFLLSLLGGVAAWRGVGLDEAETPGLQRAKEKLERLRYLGERMAAVAPELSRPKEPVERFLETVGRAVGLAA